MKTSAISSPANISTGSPSTTKPSDAATDTSFGQMLSREMAARPEAAETAKAPAAPASKNTQAARPANSKPDDAKSAKDSQTNNADGSGASAAADSQTEGKSPVDGSQIKSSNDSASADEDATLSPASAELLALVASLTQPAADAKPGKDSTVPVADEGIDGEGAAQVKLDAGNADNVGLLAASPELTQHSATQAAASNPAAVLASLEQSSASDSTVADTVLPNAAQTGLDRAMVAGQEIAPRTVAMQRANSRTDQAAATPAAQETGKFDARLAQAENNRPVPELAAQKAASEMAAPRALQDAQQPVTSAFNIGAASPTQLQGAQPQSAQAAAASTLAPQVGSPGWDQALGQRVVWMVRGEQQSASLTLNPPDLGPLQVELKVANSQATANFTAAQPEVRQALEAAMPRLREMLNEAGIQLGQASVSAGTPNNQQGTFEQSQQASRPSGARNDDADAPAQISRSQPISAGQGLVDTFA